MNERPTLRDAFTGENLIGFLLMIAGILLIPFAVLLLEGAMT